MWIIQGSNHCNNIRQPQSFSLTQFCDQALAAFQKSVVTCLNTEQAVLPILIDSYGGNIDTMNGIISLIDYGKSRGLKFATVVNSKAYSAGAMVWAFGDENLRFIGDYGKIMFHSCSAVTGGKVPEMKTTVDAYHKDQDILFEKVSKNLKKPKTWLKNKLHKLKDYDWVLSADEVVSEKLGTKYTPSFILKVEESFAIV